MENRKNTILLTVIAVATLLVAVVGATFAYFTAQGTGSQQKEIEVTSETINSMAFYIDTINTMATYIDKNIDIDATTAKFTQGGSDVTDTITATATFNANNQAAATFCYTVDLIVNSNTFEYTAENTEQLPELTLHVTKDAGTTSAPVDIIAEPTTKSDPGDLTGDSPSTINIPTTAGGSNFKHQISAAAGQRVVDTWKVTVTFVNHDFDQSSLGEQGTGEVNTGKEFRASLKFSSTACA